jgi:hypothetical protein
LRGLEFGEGVLGFAPPTAYLTLRLVKDARAGVAKRDVVAIRSVAWASVPE